MFGSHKTFVSILICLVVATSSTFASWELEANMTTERDEFAGAIVGSWMYVFGGNGNPDTTNLASGERFNLQTKTWESIPGNPHIPYGKGVEEICGVGLNGKFYVLGFEDFYEVYDPGTKNWTTLATKPTPVSAVVPVVHRGKMYLFGGFHEDDFLPDGILRTEVEMYDPSSDTWQYITDIPRVLDSMAVAIHDGSVYLIGGFDVTANAYNTEVMAFDLESKTWTRNYSTMSDDTARIFNWSMTPVIDGKIYLTGGIRNGVPTSKVTVFDVATRTWHEGPPLPEARNGHAAICDGDTIYVVGGYAEEDDLYRTRSTVYRWTPAPDSASVWPLEVGQVWTYECAALSGGDNWTWEWRVHDKLTIGADEYYKVGDGYFRSTQDKIYEWDTDAGKTLLFQAGPVGTTWTHSDDNTVEILEDSFPVQDVYGATHNAYKLGFSDPDGAWNLYVVPGLGIVRLDQLDEDPPYIAELKSATAAPSSYTYSVDRFRITGNLPGDVVEEFDNGVLAPWTIQQGTAAESGGNLTLRSPGEIASIHLNDRPVTFERSSVEVSLATGVFAVADGLGDFTIESQWTSGLPDSSHSYGMTFHYPPTGFDQVVVNISDTGVSFLQISPGSDTDAIDLNVDSQTVSVEAADISGKVVLRLHYNDTTESLSAEYSLDGGDSFLQPFSPFSIPSLVGSSLPFVELEATSSAVPVISELSTSGPSPYAFSMDRFEGVGNLPGNVVDEFGDSSVDPQWTIYDPTVTETGGRITFGSPGTVESWQLGSLNIVSEMSYIGSEFSVRDGAGDYEVTSTWSPIIPSTNQFYAMSTDSDDVEEISIGVANWGAALSEYLGVPTGLVVFFGRFGDVQAGDFDVQSMSILPYLVTGDILLRLTFDDESNLFDGSFSLDGGATFLTPFSMVAPSEGGPAVRGWYLGGESWDVQSLDPRIQVESLPVSSDDITSTSAVLKGRILDDAGDSSCLYSFRYFKKSDFPSHGVSTDEQALMTIDSKGEFARWVEWLEPGCTYVYQAYARNSSGSAVGQYMEFTTLAAPLHPIQQTIDEARDGDTVVLQPGVYTGPGNTNLDFHGKAIYLSSENGPDTCEIFCNGQARAFHFHSGEDADSVIDGFTISGGADVLGSAVYCEGASPTLANSVIRDNGPSAVWTSDVLHIDGTVQVESGAIEGPGIVDLQNDAVLQVRGLPIGCRVLGDGRLDILTGWPTVLTGSALVDLPGAGLLCSGKLEIRDSAVIQNTSIEVSNSGKVQVSGGSSLLNCQIHAVSDNPLTVDPQIPTEALAETDVFVTLSGEANFEVRGQAYCSDPEDPLCSPGAHELAEVPGLDGRTLTLARLELTPGANVTLTNHFRDQTDSPFDVLYVKDLVLGEGAQLNLAGHRLYYETVAAEPDQIVDQKVYVSQLAQINLADPNRFNSDVTTNNTPDQTFVSLVDSPDIAPEPVMYLQDHDNVSARAKTYLGRFSEDDVVVDFSYLFNSDDPDAVLEVYLSDEAGLLPLDDPHMLLAGRFAPPILGCPGSMESGEFALYSLPVTVTPLDPNEGLWLELILSEPPEPLGGFGFITMGDGRKGGAYARDLTLSGKCLGICMDLTEDGRVEVDDYTLVGAGSGRSVDSDVPVTSPLSCIDRGYSRDGRTDIGDVVGLADLMARGGSNDVKNLCSIPMAWEDTTSHVGSTFISFGVTEPMAAPAAQVNSNLLFLGKGSAYLGDQEFLGPEDLLYGFDDIGAASQQYTLTTDVGQMRLVRGDPNVMILDSDQGLCQLNGDAVVAPGQQTFDGKTVTIGIRKTGDDQLSGRPLRDVAFHNGFAYVVPVIVEESGGILYQAAAKLELTGGDYEIRQLYYDSALAPFSNQSPNLEGLREIEVDRSGRVYLLNAHYQNSSDMLWAFDNTGTLLNRHFLNRLADNPLDNPVGLCYDNHSNRLYIASGVFDKTDPNQSMLCGYDRESVLSENLLMPTQEVTVKNLQHITDISSDQQGTLWVTGLKLTTTPEVLYSYSLHNPDQRPLPGPRLALVHTSEDGASQIEAESLYEDMGIVLPTSILYVSVPSGPVPMALWRFDELGGSTAQDETGSYPGTIHGALPAQGILSSALQFDGDDDYVDFGNSADLVPEAMTLSLWMYPDELDGYLVYKSKSSFSKEYELSLSGSGVKVAIGRAGGYTNLRSSSRPDAGEWSHVAFSYGDGVLSIYVDGVLDASKTYSSTVPEKGYPLSIGGGNTSKPFKGKIDQVGIYDRVLSEDEILGLFEEGK